MNKEDTIAIIRSILNTSTRSCSVSRLNKEFKNETGVDIPSYGYGCISDFLQSIPQEVKVTGLYPIQQVSLVINEKSGHITSLVQRQRCGEKQKKYFTSNNNWMKAKASTRFSGAQEFPKIEENRNLNDFKDLKREEFSLQSPGFTYLNNSLCTSEKVSFIDLKLNASIGEYVEVCPCNIMNPDKFYFHFRKFKKKIGDFMNDLQLFYGSHKEIPEIDVSFVRPQQICAVFHKIYEETRWYRAEIQEIVSDGQVIVDFIDFGKRAEISQNKLKYLHKNFVSFPRQACAGFLANIKPLDAKVMWSLDAIKRFSDLALHKDLVGGVVFIDAEACSLGLALTFTKGPEIHINDTLVTEGHAEFEMDTLNGIASHEDGGQSKLNTFFGENKFFTSETTCDKLSGWIQKSDRLKKYSLSEVQPRVFYASQVFGSNSRLKKLFSQI